MIADPHELQRLRYTPGQDLLSRDFRDQAAFEESLRWWHNRAMHGAFGVRYGLSVRPLATAAGPSVEVAGGLAYDAFGRELIVSGRRIVRVPAGARETEPRTLVIRHRGPSDPLVREGDAGVCLGGPAAQGADLAWLPARGLRPTDGVPLARVTYRRGRPVRDPDFHHPPAARPLARPRLGHGSTVAGGTPWEIWDLGSRQRVLLGLQVSIDTRAAGFTRVPCYFAWLRGGIESRVGDGAPFYLPLFSHLAEGGLTRFRFRVLTLAFGGFDDLGPGAILARARRQLSVCWLGIQMRSDDEDVLPEVIHGHP